MGKKGGTTTSEENQGPFIGKAREHLDRIQTNGAVRFAVMGNMVGFKSLAPPRVGRFLRIVGKEFEERKKPIPHSATMTSRSQNHPPAKLQLRKKWGGVGGGGGGGGGGGRGVGWGVV